MSNEYDHDHRRWDDEGGSYMYDNGCAICDAINELHRLIEGNPEDLPFWITPEQAIVMQISYLRQTHPRTRKN